MNLDIMNLAWLEETKQNPQTAYNSWCRGYEAGLAAACKEAVLIEREACAKVCLTMASKTEDIRRAALEVCAENILARGGA